MNVNEKLKFWLRLAIGIIILAVGFSLISLSINSTSTSGLIGEKIGLALIVAGIIAVFQEVVWRPITRDELKDGINKVLEFMKGPAIHLETLVRLRYPGYHKWLINSKPQDVFISGHSVLHRMEDDFGQLPVNSLEEAICLKLSQACNIKILFLDPTWEFLDNVANAQEEKPGDIPYQTPIQLKKNIATSIGIVKRIADKLEKKQGPLPGSLDIRVCREVTQYAYHHVVCKDNDSEEMYVGLYFASELGTDSPLFVVENSNIRVRFRTHFTKIFARATPILSMSCGEKKSNFAIKYYRECKQILAVSIGEEEVAKRLP
jgi:hypothetical protein